MQALTFKRGVHPPDGKELAKDQPIKVIMPKENSELFYPMSQHIGAPCDPLVAVGDHVKVGQKIAESGAFMSSPIFASVSGEVVDIRPMLVPGGAMVKAIVVKNDGKMEEIEGLNEGKDYTTMTNDEILAAIKNAGVVGLGGAGFPTHVKLNPPKDTPIDHILINAAECEPYLTCDYRLMLEEPERIVRGLQIMLKLHPNAKGVIGIEMNKPEAIASMQKACEGIDNITVQPLVTKFPQGSEKHLIYAITKREVKSGALPASAGCIVDNVDTVCAIYMAVCKTTPLIERVFTVTGDAIADPRNFRIKIGTNTQELIEAAGGFKSEPEKVISGGPMMGTALFSLDIPVTKTASSILALRHDPVALHDASPCIHCGHCLHACPEGLVPQLLSAAAEQEQFDVFEKYGGMECIECGSCAFVCPAGRHLVQSMRYGKRQTGALIRARKAAETSNQTAQKGGAGK